MKTTDNLPLSAMTTRNYAFTERLKSLLSERLAKTPGRQNYAKHLASEFQLSEAAVRRWLKGFAPSSENLVMLARYLNVSTDWLLGLSEVRQTTHHSEPQGAPREVPFVKRDEAGNWRAFKSLPFCGEMMPANHRRHLFAVRSSATELLILSSNVRYFEEGVRYAVMQNGMPTLKEFRLLLGAVEMLGSGASQSLHVPLDHVRPLCDVSDNAAAVEWPAALASGSSLTNVLPSMPRDQILVFGKVVSSIQIQS